MKKNHTKFVWRARIERGSHRKESERRCEFSQIGVPIWGGEGFSLNGLEVFCIGELGQNRKESFIVKFVGNNR